MRQFIARSSIVCFVSVVSVVSSADLAAFVSIQERGDETVDRVPADAQASPFLGQLQDGRIPRPGEFTPQFTDFLTLLSNWS